MSLLQQLINELIAPYAEQAQSPAPARGYTADEVSALLANTWAEGYARGVTDQRNDLVYLTPNPYATGEPPSTVAEQLEITQRQLAAAEQRERDEVERRRTAEAELAQLQQNLAQGGAATNDAVQDLTEDNARLRGLLQDIARRAERGAS